MEGKDFLADWIMDGYGRTLVHWFPRGPLHAACGSTPGPWDCDLRAVPASTDRLCATCRGYLRADSQKATRRTRVMASKSSPVIRRGPSAH